MTTNKYFSIITLNVNGLNAPIKRHRVAEWIRKHDLYICCLQETHLKTKDSHRLRVKGWKKIFQANGNEKKAGIAILIFDKIDLKVKAITRDKEGHFIILKGAIQQEDITLVNIYAPNTGAPKYIKQLLEDIKGEISSNTVIVGDFNTPLTSLDKTSKQKISEETAILNDSLDQMDLIDIFRIFHPKATEYTFFSSARRTFSKIDHILGHRQSLFKFKRIEIVTSIFSDHNGIKLEINYNKNIEKNQTLGG
uniref:exodeoxyribonuclease III n=1 Tax=Myotis myotis TaxID=51298 RepID=A0A7J7YF00_MYOMY|nr:hypothetical protein mMyoMyo1_011158 [Myotis myotis]